MFRRILAVLIVAHLAACADAVSVSVTGSGPGMPPTLVYDSMSGEPLEFTLEFFNESGSAADILSWRLDLRTAPLAGATGNVEFTQVQAPTDNVLFPAPQPMTISALPSTNVVVEDFDFSFGQTLAAGTSRNVVRFLAIPDVETGGTFDLELHLDFELVDAGSFWSPLTGIPQRVAFTNPADQVAPNQSTLVRIEVLTVPEPSGCLLLFGGLSIAVVRWRSRHLRQ